MNLQKHIPALEGKTVVFFDGICNLCNGAVQFIIKRDMKRKFYFASLQSGIGQELLGSLSSKGRPKDSIILYKNGKIYSESTAILKVLSALPGIWKGAIVLLVIPGFIRDGVYRFVAKNRYAWFGRRVSCMVPGPGIQSRFID